MPRFSPLAFAAPVALAAACLATGCAESTYSQPVQPSVQGRASLEAIPPSEPAPMTASAPPVYLPSAAPAPPPAPAAPAAPATVTAQAGPLPALPSQAPQYAPQYAPPVSDAPAVVYRTYTPSYVYYPGYAPYYYRPGVHIGVSVGRPYAYRPYHYHRGWRR